MRRRATTCWRAEPSTRSPRPRRTASAPSALYGVLRRPLERRAGRRPAGATPEEALAERLEDRLAAIVVAMEDAREAGDDRRADALHARYIELATTYVARLVR